MRGMVRTRNRKPDIRTAVRTIGNAGTVKENWFDRQKEEPEENAGNGNPADYAMRKGRILAKHTARGTAVRRRQSGRKINGAGKSFPAGESKDGERIPHGDMAGRQRVFGNFESGTTAGREHPALFRFRRRSFLEHSKILKAPGQRYVGEVGIQKLSSLSRRRIPVHRFSGIKVGILGVLLLAVIITNIFGGGTLLASGSGNAGMKAEVSEEVQAYEPVIQQYAVQYGIGEYVELIKAVMMQESGGRGNDPMQASECGFNLKYPREPGGITSPEYSIAVGIQNLAACLKEAEAENPLDISGISLAIQGYNFGNGYIAWAKEKGGYSAENAKEFSRMMAGKNGWTSYGDTEYVPHVLRYYLFSGINPGNGNAALVQVAATQLGNAGGEPYWSWYGFSSRVEWCACFVSWCADQCGLIESGEMPKFAKCTSGVEWFQRNGRWSAGGVPAPGDIIFFDWNGDGNADHVGIVEKIENGYVCTIEGNNGDMCRRGRYELEGNLILGYGIS